MIEIKSLRIELPGFAIQDIDLSIQDGEFFILLGPTGAGKTLMLEAIAGIVPITSGQIQVKGKDITGLPPEHRGISIMYQDYALFPHLSVVENIVYGLRYHKIEPDKSKAWVNRLIEHLGLQPLIHRSIHRLSGGEKQRISLARALAVNPSVLLLDEPLSALDPNFREDIREVLKKLHQEVGITFLMVTHDFSEAMFLGERTAVLNYGKIEQTGSISEVFQHPMTPFMAEFVGMKNVFPAKFEDTRALVDDKTMRLDTPPPSHMKYVAIRPEDIMIKKEGVSENGLNVFKGIVLGITNRGLYYEISIKAGKIIFTAMLSKTDLFEMSISETKNIYIAFKSSAIHVF